MSRRAMLMLALFQAACGAAGTAAPRVERAAPPDTPSPLGPAIDALLASPFCEPDACVDPFPLAAVRRWDARGDRVAIAGPGAIAGVYEGGAWELAALPEHRAAHDVAFAPDGSLFALSEDALFRRDGGAWTLVVEREDGSGSWSALFARAADDVWIGTVGGAVLRVSGGVAEPMSPGPRSIGIDRIWDAGGSIAVRGPFGGALWDGRRWHVSVTDEELEAFDRASGCGAFGLAERLFDEEVLYPNDGADGDDEYDEPQIPRTRPLPPGPDRTPAGWIASLDPERRGRFGGWLERAPSEVTDLVRAEQSWAAVGRSASGNALWGRIDGALVVRELAVARPVAVAIAGARLVVAGADGSIALFDGPDAAPAMSRVPADSPLVDALGRSDGSAVVLASNGDVFTLDAEGTVALLHRIGRPMRAIDGDERRLIAVGDAGAIVRADGEEWSVLDAGSTVDLSAVELDGERALAAGAAGTIVRIDGRSATVLPRVTYEALVAVHAQGDTVLALSARGAVVRVNGGAWSRRVRELRRDAAALRLVQWVPTDAEPWTGIEDRLDVVLDAPGAVLPYAMLSRLHPHAYGGPRGEERSPLALAVPSYVEEELHQPDMSCCEGAGEDDRATIADAAECVEDPWRLFCALAEDPAFAIDVRGRAVLRVVQTGERDADYCAPLRFEVVRLGDGEVVRTSPVMGCEDGREARERAAWTFLAEPEQQAFSTWETLADFELGGPRNAELFVHRTAASDALVFVSPDNRVATSWVTIRRPTGGAPIDGWARIGDVRASPDGAFVLVAAEIASGNERRDFLWMGRSPGRPRARGANAEQPQPRDVASCDELVVSDADGETNVRALPTPRADVVGTLPNGTPFRARARHGRWVRLSEPALGWVFSSNLRCAE